MPDWLPYIFVLGFTLGGIVLIGLMVKLMLTERDEAKNPPPAGRDPFAGEDRDDPDR